MPHTPRPVVVAPPNACQLPAFASVLVSADAVVAVAMAANATTAVIPHRFMLSPSLVSTLSVAHLDGHVSGGHAWSSMLEALYLSPRRQVWNALLTAMVPSSPMIHCGKRLSWNCSLSWLLSRNSREKLSSSARLTVNCRPASPSS